MVLESFGKAIRQEKEIQRILIGKEEVELPAFVEDMILYLKVPKNSTRKLLDLLSIAKWKDTKSTYKSLAFLYTNKKHVETEIRKIIPLTIALKDT
jgi:hypothetical protein